jgi:hypothetical protein
MDPVRRDSQIRVGLGDVTRLGRHLLERMPGKPEVNSCNQAISLNIPRAGGLECNRDVTAVDGMLQLMDL